MSTPATTAAQPPVFQPATIQTNTMAILSLVFAFLFWPAAIVFGHIAHHEITRTGERGRGLATAGLVIGYACLTLVTLVIGVAIAAS